MTWNCTQTLQWAILPNMLLLPVVLIATADNKATDAFAWFADFDLSDTALTDLRKQTVVETLKCYAAILQSRHMTMGT